MANSLIHYHRFCEQPVVNDANPQEPKLEVCGKGYKNRSRSPEHKSLPICEGHLKSKITRERCHQ